MKVTLAVVSLLVLVSLAIWKSKQDERHQREAVEKARLDAIGTPAGAEQIRHDGAYFVNGTVTDQWPDRTNYTVVLQEVTIFGHNDYRHNRTNRLFMLPWNLERGYYRFWKDGTNLSYDAIPAPKPQ